MTKRTAKTPRPGAVEPGQTRYYLRDGVVSTRSLQGGQAGALEEGAGGLVAKIEAPEGAQEISAERAAELLGQIKGQALNDRAERKAKISQHRRTAYLEMVDQGVSSGTAEWLTGHRAGALDEREEDP